jgi:hypothetical protein
MSLGRRGVFIFSPLNGLIRPESASTMLASCFSPLYVGKEVMVTGKAREKKDPLEWKVKALAHKAEG